MKLIPRLEGLYELSFGMVSAFLIQSGNEFVLIDTGLPGNTDKILQGINSLGSQAENLRHILISQLHSDHVGNLAELKRRTGATVYAHKLEAEAIAEGSIMRSGEPAPGLFKKLIFALIAGQQSDKRIEGTAVDVLLEDRQSLDLAAGLQVVYTPGHTIGHCSFLWNRHGGVLFVGDAASGGRQPGYPMLFENRAQGEESLAKIGTLQFNKAFFAHGKPILTEASKAFADRW